MNWNKVDSSSLKAFAYDADTKTLAIEFKQGEVYTYANVPAETVARLVAAESKGTFVNDNIAYSFKYQKVQK